MKGVRLFLPSAEGPGGEIDLTAEQAQVLSRVLRLVVGQEVTLLNGQGGLRACELLALGKKSARVRVRAVEVAPRPKPDITLCYALPKGEKASEVIRRCVEWGVNRIIFLTSEFAVAIWDSRRGRSGRRVHRLGSSRLKGIKGLLSTLILRSVTRVI